MSETTDRMGLESAAMPFDRRGKSPPVELVRRIGGGRDAEVWLASVRFGDGGATEVVAKIFQQKGRNAPFLSEETISEEFVCLDRFWSALQKAGDPMVRCPRPRLLLARQQTYLMEYEKGRVLARAIQEKIESEARIAERIASALGAFHDANGREFGDFSSNNILLHERDSICLLDPLIADPRYGEIKRALGVTNAAADAGYWVFWHSMAALCNPSWWHPRPLTQRWRLTTELLRAIAERERRELGEFRSCVRRVAVAHWQRFTDENPSLARRIGANFGRLLATAMTR